MKRLIAIAAAAAALVLVAAASADVARYQFQSGTLTANVLSGSYVHVYTIAIDPCSGAFTGTGGIQSLGLAEKVAGTLAGSTIDFSAEYLGSWAPYAWTYSGPMAGGTGNGPGGQTFPVSFALANVTDVSHFKNHGDYVSQASDKQAAAHSCIGMPIP